MPGGVTHGERELPYANHVAVRELPVGRRQRIRLHAERPRLLDHVIVQEPVRRMQVHGRAGLLAQVGHADDVVDVRVREPDRRGADAQRRELVRDQPGALAGIDDGAGSTGLVHHEVAVLGKAAVRDGDDVVEPTLAHGLGQPLGDTDDGVGAAE